MEELTKKITDFKKSLNKKFMLFSASFKKGSAWKMSRLNSAFGPDSEAFFKGDYFTEEAKIFLAGIFIIASALWIGKDNFVFVAHSESISEISNAQIKEKSEVPLSPESKVDAKAINGYKLKSPEEQCREDKEEKKTSSLCGKDDEEKIKAREAEEKKKQYSLARRKSAVSGPQPYVFDVVNGRKVCNKKNDNPGKSKQGKGKHMDMECCLDPDEIPNPNCHYDQKKYGKYM